MVLNIIGIVIIGILFLIVSAILFGIFLILPFKYINNRLEYIPSTILPFLLLIILTFIMVFVFADSLTYFTKPSDFYVPTVYYFVYSAIVYISIYICTEICRYIEYKVNYNIDKTYIHVDKENMYSDDGYFWYYQDKIKVEEKGDNDIFKLDLKKWKPTLHGKDKYDNQYVECCITNIKYDKYNDAIIEYKYLNPIRYNFANDTENNFF